MGQVVGPRASLDSVEERKIAVAAESVLSFGLLSSHCTGWAVKFVFVFSIKILNTVFVLLINKHVEFTFFIMLYSDITGA